MTANVITYRGRSAAREVGKALGFDAAQVDRLAKVMNQFEFIDPGRHAAAASGERSASISNARSRAAVRAAVARDAGSAAASRPALRRHGDLPGPARRGRAARERQHARPRRRAVGQGRLRRHGDRQGRSARPRHDGGDAGRDRAGERRTRRSVTRSRRVAESSLMHPLRINLEPSRSLDLAHLPQNDPAVYEMLQRGRHDRRLPGRVARADGDAAAAEAGLLLRPRRRGGDHPAGPDRRADGASVSESARRARAGDAIRIRRSSRSWRARSACRSSRSSCCAWRWWRPGSPADRPRSCAARWASSDPSSG